MNTIVFSPCRRFWWLLIGFYVFGLSMGCAAAKHGWKSLDYEGRILPASHGLGAEALEDWEGFDLDVRKFLKKYRRPDYILATGLLTVHLFYVEEGVQFTFERPAVGFRTKVSRKAIPAELRDTLIRRGPD